MNTLLRMMKNVEPEKNPISRSEREIRDIFNGFEKELYDRKWHIYQEITDWRNRQTRRIEEHAHQQRKLFDQEYLKQQNFIEDSREQFLNAARPYEQRGDNQEIDQLLAQCKALKCELGTIVFSESAVLSIQFLPEEQVARKKRNEQRIERPADNNNRNNFDGGYEYHDVNNRGADGSASTRGAPASSNRENRSTAKSNRSGDGSTPLFDSNDSRRCDISSVDECSVCSMLFSSNMTKSERVTHVNTHYQEF